MRYQSIEGMGVGRDERGVYSPELPIPSKFGLTLIEMKVPSVMLLP